MNKYAVETTVGVFLVFGLLCIGYMAVKLGHVSLFGGHSYSLFARFTTVSGLRVGSPVNMLGIEVGRVERLTMDQKDQEAVVEIRIQKDIKVYGDAIASIKTEGLIGDMFLSIDPGGSGKLLEHGGTITETQPAVDMVDLIGKYAFGEVKKQKGIKKEKLEAIYEQMFDGVELSMRTLGKNWTKLNPAQQQEFIQLYRQILEKAYIDKILSYTNEKIVFSKENMLSNNQAEIQTNVITSSQEIPIFYKVILKDGIWKVYDVVVENVSLVQNYRSQFNSILAKNTPDQLLEILRKKVKG